MLVWSLPAALLAAVFFHLTGGTPSGKPASPLAPSAVDELRVFSELALPSCLNTQDRDRLSQSGRFGFDGDMGRTLAMIPDGNTLRSEAVFSWDREREELRPVNDAALRLADMRTACP